MRRSTLKLVLCWILLIIANAMASEKDNPTHTVVGSQSIAQLDKPVTPIKPQMMFGDAEIGRAHV